MAKVFYDRSGKAHTIGDKKGASAEKPDGGQKPSHEKKTFGAKPTGGAKPSSDEPKRAPTGGGGGKPFNKNKANKRKHLGNPRFAMDDNIRQERSEARRANAGKPESPWAAPREEEKKPFVRGERSFAKPAGSVGGRRSEATAPSRPAVGGGFSRGGESRGGSARGGGGRGGYDGGGRGGRGGRSDSRGGKKEFHRGGGGGARGGRNDRPRGPRTAVEIHPDWMKLKGVIDKNKKGSAFLVFDRRDLEDIFIPRYYIEQLFHGDRVEAYINQDGEIEDLKVLEHRFKEIFGRVYLDERAKTKARVGYLVYERKKAKEEIYLPSVPAEVKEGDWVKAELIFGENQDQGSGIVSAKIVQVIGQVLPASFDIQMVAGEFNLTEHHTFDAVKQAEGYTLEIPGKDEVGRTDLRRIPFMTIDGERARDFDDAVFVERTDSKGYRLWVAIADVSHYVKVGTPLDREAYARATSVYFPERAFHMLPRALSEELCSLKPHVARLTMAVSIEFGQDGAKGPIKLYDAIINSQRRATYNEIEAEKDRPEHAVMFELYRILREQRKTRGSIDFDFPEAEIILDEKTGEPQDIVVRARNDAHRLIEEFMIGANEAVSEWMLERKLPFVFRVHDEPSPEAIEKFKKLSKTMGVALFDRGDGVPRPKVLAEFIHKLKGHPSEIVLATALLRSMRQAIYSADHGEHFGLASNAYTHFTSPIRRYPDLVVHRQLRAALHREQKGEPRPSDKELEATQNELNEIAEHCSYRERIASEAERESIRFKSVRLMSKHVGEEFDGKVNGLTQNGMFVQLHHPYCEGMVSVDSLGDDFYEFDETRMMLAGRRSHRSFQIGQPVRIQVVRVDLDARQVEFQLLSGGVERPNSQPKEVGEVTETAGKGRQSFDKPFQKKKK
jgi:ribonuclease R